MCANIVFHNHTHIIDTENINYENQLLDIMRANIDFHNQTLKTRYKLYHESNYEK